MLQGSAGFKEAAQVPSQNPPLPPTQIYFPVDAQLTAYPVGTLQNPSQLGFDYLLWNIVEIWSHLKAPFP
jgi:hypothetical protein